MLCHWCGEAHGLDRLCQRAQRGITRRSFCFLFGAGVGAAALGVLPSADLRPLSIEVDFGQGFVVLTDQMIKASSIDVEEYVEKFVAECGQTSFTLNGYWT